MGELIAILREIFPGANPYELSGVGHGVCLRQPGGYYKIYEDGLNYRVEAYMYGEDTMRYSRIISRGKVGEWFRALASK